MWAQYWAHNLPKAQPVSNVSCPPNLIPPWNEHNLKDIEALFEFTYGFLIDNAPLILFFPKFKKVRDNVRTYIASYGFSLAKNRWIINKLPLCSPLITTITICNVSNVLNCCFCHLKCL